MQDRAEHGFAANPPEKPDAKPAGPRRGGIPTPKEIVEKAKPFVPDIPTEPDAPPAPPKSKDA